MSTDPIVMFYTAQQADTQGRTIEEVWAFNETQLEDASDYLWWLFPLGGASTEAPGEPEVTAETARAFAADPELGERLRRSLDLMLGFYGLVREGDRIQRGGGFESRRLGWLYPDDHNHQRLARIVRSLALLGEPDLARSLRDELVKIADEYGVHSVSRETRGHWAHLLAR